MKKIIKEKFIFLFLLELGLVISTWILLPDFKFVTYTFLTILLGTSGYKLNKSIEKSKLITHEKTYVYSIIEIAVWGALIVLLQGVNNYVTIFLTVAFYLCLFVIISTLIYIIMKSINKKNKIHFKYLINIIIFIIITAIINNFKGSLNNEMFVNILSLYYNIAVTMLTFYLLTFVTYKCFKLNSQ